MRDRYIPNLSREIRLTATRLRNFWNSGNNPEHQAFARLNGNKIHYDATEMVKQFDLNLQTFITMCQIRKIVPVLMTMASRFKDNPDNVILDGFNPEIIGYREYKQLFDLFNDNIRLKARENNIPLIDLATAIPPEKQYIYDAIHYNDYGSIRAAEVIKDHLKPVVQQLLAQKSLPVSQANQPN